MAVAAAVAVLVDTADAGILLNAAAVVALLPLPLGTGDSVAVSVAVAEVAAVAIFLALQCNQEDRRLGSIYPTDACPAFLDFNYFIIARSSDAHFSSVQCSFTALTTSSTTNLATLSFVTNQSF